MSRQSVLSLPAALAALALCSLSAAGCNHTPSEQEALKKSLEVNNRAQETVVPFSGTVTIDGQPPVADRRTPVFVVVYDPKNPPKGRQPPFTARCDKEGHFQFNTYGTGDGLPAGSYVVLFAQPKADGDALKNLYNDPDKNDKEERFRIELTPPGKTNWSFDLAVAGKEPNTTPGEHSVMADRGKKKKAG
jgi:hypothetical protein